MGSFTPMLFCRGTHFEVGFRMGQTFKKKIDEYYTLFEDLHEKFLPFYHTDEGRKICEDYLEVMKDSFPQYVDEMHGISDGSEIPFEMVLLMHLRVELQTYIGKEQVPECSTVYLNTSDKFVLAHNEDTSNLVRDRGYLVSLHIIEESPRGKHNIAEEKFTAFCYPGIIPGNSMNFNCHGLVLSVNALYPSLLKLKRTPRQFINRASLCASNVAMLKEIVVDEGNGISTGCSLNVAWISSSKERMMINLEIAPSDDEAVSVVSEHVVDISNGHYDHFNMYKHSSIPEIPGRTTSSIHRQTRANELPVPENIKDMLLVLGDTEDNEYPIYRTPSATDSGDTVATGVFDLLNTHFTMYVANPKESNPIVQLPMVFEC